MAKKVKMIKKIKYNAKMPNGNLKLDLSRFEEQFENAQYELDTMVMTDMIPYMPMETGTFINVTKAMSAAIAGSGTVIAGAPPMGRFLYEGKKMVDSVTSRGPFNVADEGEVPVWRYRKGAKLKATDKPLSYNKEHHPNVTNHWFDAAKGEHCDNWVSVTKRIAGGGSL
jgi:hypothetical protein